MVLAHERTRSPGRAAPTGRDRAPGPVDSPEEAILRLQRSAGNSAITALLGRVVQRDDPDPKKPSAAGSGDQASRGGGSTGMTNPGLGNPGATTGGMTNPGMGNPGATTSGMTNPGITASGMTNPSRPPPSLVIDVASVMAAIAALALGLPAPTGTAAKPSFHRDPGCDVEAPTLPTAPAELPFAPDPAATLPAKEAEPDLSAIPADQPWWSDPDAEAFGGKLADCYARRGLKGGQPVDRAAKLAALQTDFDMVVRGWLAGRTRYGRWARLPKTLAAMLERRRAAILRKEKAADARLPRDKRRSKEDIDAAVEAQMQHERHDIVEDVRRQVAIATWGWMAERREKLDFDTIQQKPSGALAHLPELLTTAEMRTIIHDILVEKKRELSDTDKARAIARAQAVRDRAAKRAKQPFTPLSDDEQASVVAKAEYERVRALGLAGQLKTALIKARTAKDEANLVAPTKADIKGWDADRRHTRIHKDLVALLKDLEAQYPKGFSAGTYRISVEGDHASAGFEGRFRSVDMYPRGGPSRVHKPFGQLGFFDQQTAFDFALAIDRTVAGKGTFQILYNDFEVARELNKVLKNGRVYNVDNVVADKGGAANLNWHGPLVTHFHVDFAI